MRPDISEFSYGYAVTDELIHWRGTTVTAAPYFPSLRAEGQPGGGFDVMLNRPGIPLFLQFKLADCMVRRNATEVRNGPFNVPYYRMHLRAIRHSRQHEMLLDLEQAGQEVYYSAPAFHTPEALNDAYLGHNVRANSIWVRPSLIGPLPDDLDHYVAFQIPGVTVFCSRPRRIKKSVTFDDFANTVEAVLRQRGERALKPDSLEDLAGRISEIAEKPPEISRTKKREAREQVGARKPLERISFYSQVFLGCRLFILRHREEAQWKGEP